VFYFFCFVLRLLASWCPVVIHHYVVVILQGWIECVGCADRSCFDLTQHTKMSGTKLVASRRLAQPVSFDIEL